MAKIDKDIVITEEKYGSGREGRAVFYNVIEAAKYEMDTHPDAWPTVKPVLKVLRPRGGYGQHRATLTISMREVR